MSPDSQNQNNQEAPTLKPPAAQNPQDLMEIKADDTETISAPVETPSASKTPQAPNPEQPKPIERRFRENMSFFSDLFKLKVSKMLQWKGWTKAGKDAPLNENGHLNDDWFYTEHCHYFHTMDSSGRVQDYCQPVAQHKHKIKVTRDPDNHQDVISVECVSGPLKEVITDKYGKRQKIWVEDPHDKHRHETEYLKSNQLSRPNVNVEAAKVMSSVQASGNSKTVFDENGKSLGKLEVR